MIWKKISSRYSGQSEEILILGISVSMIIFWRREENWLWSAFVESDAHRAARFMPVRTISWPPAFWKVLISSMISWAALDWWGHLLRTVRQNVQKLSQPVWMMMGLRVEMVDN